MKKIFYLLPMCFAVLFCLPVAWADAFSCGDGYVLAEHSKIDGITTMSCEKLWCMDLETGRMMGGGDTVANGYRATGEPIELTVKNSESGADISIKCFGERK